MDHIEMHADRFTWQRTPSPPQSEHHSETTQESPSQCLLGWMSLFQGDPDLFFHGSSTPPEGMDRIRGDLYDKIAQLCEERRAAHEVEALMMATAQPMKVPMPESWMDVPPPQSHLMPRPLRAVEKDEHLVGSETILSDRSESKGWSIGTKGHPHSCAHACKYYRRKGGCHLKEQCPSCHRCFWRRAPLFKEDEPLQQLNNETPCAAPPELLSVGSRGHPFTCQPPCKYAKKMRGCKDGILCDRCHCCTTARKGQYPKVRLPYGERLSL